MKVEEIMSSHPEYLSPDVTVHQAAKKMKELDCGFIPIGENDRLVGIVTDRDIALRCAAKGLDPKKTTLRDVMTEKVLYCYTNDEVKKAADSMCKQQVRRLLVLTPKKRLAGIITLGDIALGVNDDHLKGEVIEAVSERH